MIKHFAATSDAPDGPPNRVGAVSTRNTRKGFSPLQWGGVFPASRQAEKEQLLQWPNGWFDRSGEVEGVRQVFCVGAKAPEWKFVDPRFLEVGGDD